RDRHDLPHRRDPVAFRSLQSLARAGMAHRPPVIRLFTGSAGRSVIVAAVHVAPTARPEARSCRGCAGLRPAPAPGRPAPTAGPPPPRGRGLAVRPALRSRYRAAPVPALLAWPWSLLTPRADTGQLPSWHGWLSRARGARSCPGARGEDQRNTRAANREISPCLAVGLVDSLYRRDERNRPMANPVVHFEIRSADP